MQLKRWGVDPQIKRVGDAVLVLYTVPIRHRMCAACETVMEICQVKGMGFHRADRVLCSPRCRKRTKERFRKRKVGGAT